jgi:hypothetical protein
LFCNLAIGYRGIVQLTITKKSIYSINQSPLFHTDRQLMKIDGGAGSCRKNTGTAKNADGIPDKSAVLYGFVSQYYLRVFHYCHESLSLLA